MDKYDILLSFLVLSLAHILRPAARQLQKQARKFSASEHLIRRIAPETCCWSSSRALAPASLHQT